MPAYMLALERPHFFGRSVAPSVGIKVTLLGTRGCVPIRCGEHQSPVFLESRQSPLFFFLRISKQNLSPGWSGKPQKHLQRADYVCSKTNVGSTSWACSCIPRGVWTYTVHSSKYISFSICD